VGLEYWSLARSRPRRVLICAEEGVDLSQINRFACYSLRIYLHPLRVQRSICIHHRRFRLRRCANMLGLTYYKPGCTCRTCWTIPLDGLEALPAQGATKTQPPNEDTTPAGSGRPDAAKGTPEREPSRGFSAPGHSRLETGMRPRAPVKAAAIAEAGRPSGWRVPHSLEGRLTGHPRSSPRPPPTPDPVKATSQKAPLPQSR
jgi:hypothetical protein